MDHNHVPDAFFPSKPSTNQTRYNGTYFKSNSDLQSTSRPIRRSSQELNNVSEPSKHHGAGITLATLLSLSSQQLYTLYTPHKKEVDMRTRILLSFN
jgi:hypothetical protein